MSDEEAQRATGFLLESRAKNEAQIGESREMIAELSGTVAETNRPVQTMAASQSELNEMLIRTVTDLAGAQRQTEARLDRLAAAVEQFIGG